MLKDKGKGCSSLIMQDIPVLKSMILLSSPPEFLMVSQN